MAPTGRKRQNDELRATSSLQVEGCFSLSLFEEEILQYNTQDHGRCQWCAIPFDGHSSFMRKKRRRVLGWPKVSLCLASFDVWFPIHHPLQPKYTVCGRWRYIRCSWGSSFFPVGVAFWAFRYYSKDAVNQNVQQGIYTYVYG